MKTKRMLVQICWGVALLAFARAPATAADAKRERPLPYVVLTQPPTVRVRDKPLDPEVHYRIEKLIFDLRDVKSRDVGMLKLPDSFRTIFVPLGELDLSGGWPIKPFRSNPTIRRLVELGPQALPQLLESLDDEAQTGLVVTARSVGTCLTFDERIHGNPAIPAESVVLGLDRWPYTESVRFVDHPFGLGLMQSSEIESYRVKVGDVCFCIVGQIVGRDYSCLAYNRPQHADVVVCSPVHRKATRDTVQKLWSTKHPRQLLLESLLLDYSTRDIRHPDFSNAFGEDFQCEAAMRMLYYFADETAELVSRRLLSLDVSKTDDYESQLRSNGVRAPALVSAIGWSDEERIRSALRTLSEKATDPNVLDAIRNARKSVARRDR